MITVPPLLAPRYFLFGQLKGLLVSVLGCISGSTGTALSSAQLSSSQHLPSIPADYSSQDSLTRLDLTKSRSHRRPTLSHLQRYLTDSCNFFCSTLPGLFSHASTHFILPLPRPRSRQSPSSKTSNAAQCICRRSVPNPTRKTHTISRANQRGSRQSFYTP